MRFLAIGWRPISQKNTPDLPPVFTVMRTAMVPLMTRASARSGSTLARRLVRSCRFDRAKDSGEGAEGGPDALEACLNTKTATMTRVQTHPSKGVTRSNSPICSENSPLRQIRSRSDPRERKAATIAATSLRSLGLCVLWFSLRSQRRRLQLKAAFGKSPPRFSLFRPI